jgi:secretion/DNA translocation related CpaE-like protein
MTQQAWTPNGRRRPVALVGGSQFVRDQVARSCAAVGVPPLFTDLPAEAIALDPVVLLVGAEQPDGAAYGQREVIVVGAADEEAHAWGKAAGIQASRVVIVPQGVAWLAEHLGRSLSPAAAGTITGFLGAAGGSGVSTLAVWCARARATDVGPALLIDGHALGGGLELALGIEEHPGVRWHELGGIRGKLSPEQLAAALPAVGSLTVLSHAAQYDGEGPGDDGTGAAGAVLEAARGAFGASFIDLGGSGNADPELLSACDRIVLLVPARPRGVAAAARILQVLGSRPITVVLRGPVLDGLDAWLVAEILGHEGPLAYLPSVRGVARAEADRRMLDLTLPRGVRRVVEGLLVGTQQTTGMQQTR